MDRQNVCFGFIGTGNMGSALARAVRRRLDGSQILLANQTMEKASRLAEELDAMAVDNHAVAREADYIFLGVKPQVMEDMLKKIAPVLALRGKSFILVTMATGLTIAKIQSSKSLFLSSMYSFNSLLLSPSFTLFPNIAAWNSRIRPSDINNPLPAFPPGVSPQCPKILSYSWLSLQRSAIFRPKYVCSL